VAAARAEPAWLAGNNTAALVQVTEAAMSLAPERQSDCGCAKLTYWPGQAGVRDADAGGSAQAAKPYAPAVAGECPPVSSRSFACLVKGMRNAGSRNAWSCP
jgi:hypothetical protein